MKKSILYSILIILIVLGILLSYNFIKSKNNPQNHKIEFGIAKLLSVILKSFLSWA